MRSVVQAERAGQVLVGDDVTAGEGAAPAHRLDLQFAIQEADRVVTVYCALKLQRKDTLQIAACAGHKGSARLRRRHLKAAVELGDVAFAEESIRLLERRASGQSQLLG